MKGSTSSCHLESFGRMHAIRERVRLYYWVYTLALEGICRQAKVMSK